jgi:anti-sigma regulatory factor (Ser/Thr protein kinase)
VSRVAAVAGGDRPHRDHEGPDGHSYPVRLAGLAQLRDRVAEHARRCGLPTARISDFVLVANELTSNVIRHGGGMGRLRLWHDAAAVYCEVTDFGPGLSDPDQAGHSPSRPEAMSGRGLWIIRQLSDEVRIDSGPQGTRVTVAVALS